MKDKKDKFSNKAKAILETPKPSGIGDFLDEEKRDVRNSVNTDNGNSVNTEIRTDTIKTTREEFRLPIDLADKLRKYAFETRMTKTAVVVEALEKFLK